MTLSEELLEFFRENKIPTLSSRKGHIIPADKVLLIRPGNDDQVTIELINGDEVLFERIQKND